MNDRHPLDTMTDERYFALQADPELQLTKAEREAGYRHCCEWDGLLIHASHPEAKCCECLKEFQEKNNIVPMNYEIPPDTEPT